MEHDLLETTTPERCVLEVARPRFFTMLTGPDQLTNGLLLYTPMLETHAVAAVWYTAVAKVCGPRPTLD